MIKTYISDKDINNKTIKGEAVEAKLIGLNMFSTRVLFEAVCLL